MGLYNKVNLNFQTLVIDATLEEKCILMTTETLLLAGTKHVPAFGRLYRSKVPDDGPGELTAVPT